MHLFGNVSPERKGQWWLAIQHHRHHEHQHVDVFFVCLRDEDSSAVGVLEILVFIRSTLSKQVPLIDFWKTIIPRSYSSNPFDRAEIG